MSGKDDGPRFLRRWLKKREFLAYYVLYKHCTSEPCNVGKATDRLVEELAVSRRVALNIIRRLVRLSLLVSTGSLLLRAAPLDSVLDAYLRSYRESRRRRMNSEDAGASHP